MCLGSKPKAPTPPPQAPAAPTPPPQTPIGDDTSDAARRKAAGKSTILTSPRGVTTGAATATKTLLGA